jgi:hypothetical protein
MCMRRAVLNADPRFVLQRQAAGLNVEIARQRFVA